MKKNIFIFFLLWASCAFAQPSPPDQAEAETESSQASATASNKDEDISLETSLGLRDPFRRPSPKLAVERDDGGKIPELQRYDIDKFKLVGVITGQKNNKALVSTPDGKMHVISEKVVIGSRKGVIKRILQNAIVIEERVVNLLGQEEKVESEIHFENDEKNKKEFL